MARIRLSRRWHALRSCHPLLAARGLLRLDALLNKSTIAQQHLVLRANHSEPDRSTTRIQHALLAVRRQEPWGSLLLISCCPHRREETSAPISIILFHRSESWTGSHALQGTRTSGTQGLPLTYCPFLPPPRGPRVYHCLSQHRSKTLESISGPSTILLREVLI